MDLDKGEAHPGTLGLPSEPLKKNML